MRRITIGESEQRGCLYCMDVCSSKGMAKEVKDRSKKKIRYANGIACPHERCPYTAMDEYKTYDAYCESLSDKYAELLGVFDTVYA